MNCLTAMTGCDASSSSLATPCRVLSSAQLFFPLFPSVLTRWTVQSSALGHVKVRVLGVQLGHLSRFHAIIHQCPSTQRSLAWTAHSMDSTQREYKQEVTGACTS
jgi:hypothetical protein